MVLLAGTLLARGRRTVTIALRQMGLEDSPQFSKYHHVLNRARWSSLQLSRCLLNLLVKTFVQTGGAIEIVIDETLERRQGIHISKRGYYYDSARSTHEHLQISSGLRSRLHVADRDSTLDETLLGVALLECPCHVS